MLVKIKMVMRHTSGNVEIVNDASELRITTRSYIRTYEAAILVFQSKMAF